MNLFVRSYIVGCILSLPIIGNSQEIVNGIDSLNQIIGSQYIASYNGPVLIISGFREGIQVKTDKVNIHDLDITTVTFSKEEHSVIVKCYSDLDGCVEKTLIDGEKSFRNRLVIGIEEGVSGEIVAVKLGHLLTEMAKKY